jgi:hypothetical protein
VAPHGSHAQCTAMLHAVGSAVDNVLFCTCVLLRRCAGWFSAEVQRLFERMCAVGAAAAGEWLHLLCLPQHALYHGSGLG